MANKVNKRPLSAREGKVYLDGSLVADTCKFKLVFKPKLWEGKTLCEAGTNRRWIGYDITGEIEAWKTTPLYKKKVTEYIESGETPEFTIQAVSEDKHSDYYEINKGEAITAIGCVFTDEIPLIDMDTDGDVVKESLKFGAYDLVS